MNKQNIREIIDRIVLKFKSSINGIKDLINKNPNAKKLIGILLLNVILLIIVFFLLSLGKLRPSLKTNPTPTPFRISPTPTPTPVPLVQGPQTFSIGMKGTPEMYEVWFNTIDPKKGTQQVKLKVRDKIGKIISVKATVKTERLRKIYNLSRSEGTALDGVWAGSWRVNDKYNKNFVITFYAEDDKGSKSSVDLTIR